MSSAPRGPPSSPGGTSRMPWLWPDTKAGSAARARLEGASPRHRLGPPSEDGCRARSGLSDEQLAAAYRRDGRRLLVWLTRRTYDAQLAVDLVGETYARALESRRRYTGDPADPE